MSKNITPEEKTAKKAKRKKRTRKVLLSILAVIVIFAVVTTAITCITAMSNKKKAQSFPEVGCNLNYEKNNEGTIDIMYDGNLKVLQITDVHLGGGWLSAKKDGMALNAVAAMVTAEKPDLVIVTGDIAYPVPFQSGTFNNKTGAMLFATLMEKLGVYWTLGYGNHDTELYSYYSREEITEYYTKNYPHCILLPGPDDIDGVGNQVLNIKNSDGIITRSLIIIDSHSYIEGDYFGAMQKYDNVHENQIAWYADTVKALPVKNAEVCKTFPAEKALQYATLCEKVPTSVFQHIPPNEYREAWEEYENNGCNDTENVKYAYGAIGESGRRFFCPTYDDKLVETMLECGSTDTLFCGHDHLNCMSVNYKGINLVYGYSIDYLAYIGIYKLGSQRGCTVINIDADGAITYEPMSYYQDKYVSFYDKEDVTMQVLGEQN